MAAQIINQIALGPFLSATLSFANHQVTSFSQRPKSQQVQMQPVQNTNVESGYSYAPYYYPISSPRQDNSGGHNRIFGLFLHLLHPVVMVALVLAIIGGVDRAPGSSTDQIDLHKYKNGITMSKVSSVLFLATISLFTIVAIRFIAHKRRQGTTISEFSSAPAVTVPDAALLFMIIPLLLVRVLYTFMYSFDMNKNDRSVSSKFDQQKGSWVIYLFLGFIPQITVLAAFTVFGLVHWRNERVRAAV